MVEEEIHHRMTYNSICDSVYCYMYIDDDSMNHKLGNNDVKQEKDYLKVNLMRLT